MSIAREALALGRDTLEVLRALTRALEEMGPRTARLWIIAYLEMVADDEMHGATDSAPESLTWEQALRRVVRLLRAEMRN